MVELGPRHAARRRGAPDGAARLERRRARRSSTRARWPTASPPTATRPRRSRPTRTRASSATAKVVRINRTNPPDAILREVLRRTGDRPFARIEDVISADELAALSEGYKRVAGYDRESLEREPR